MPSAASIEIGIKQTGGPEAVSAIDRVTASGTAAQAATDRWTASQQQLQARIDAVTAAVGTADAANRKQVESLMAQIAAEQQLATIIQLRATETKQYDVAAEFFNLAIVAKPKQPDEVFMVWGLGLLTGNRPAEAAKVFQRAIDEKAAAANDPIFDFYLAGALELAGRTDEALAAARTAAKMKPASPRFCVRPAWVLYFAKRNDDAMKAYRELVEKFDADHDSDEAREVMHEARLALSNLCSLKGDNAAAEEWLEQVLDEFPDDKGAMNDLGYLWADANKNLGRARRMIQAAVDAEPDNVAYRDSLGWVLFRQGKYAEAVAQLEKAASDKNPDKTPDGAVLDHLGDAYQQAGRHDKAVETWRKAAEVLRKDKETDKAKLVEKKINGK